MIKKAWEQVGLFGNNYDILFNNVTVINNPNSSVNTPFEEFGTNNVGTMMMDKLSFQLNQATWKQFESRWVLWSHVLSFSFIDL